MVKDNQQVLSRSSTIQSDIVQKTIPFQHNQQSLASSRIPNFAQMNSKQRCQALVSRNIISHNDSQALNNSGALSIEQAEKFIENPNELFDFFILCG